MQTPLLGVILALMGPAALQGPGIRPADLVGDWVLALDLYGETNHQRMTVETTGDRITVATGRPLGDVSATALLVRPDGYVAWASSAPKPGVDELRRVLAQWFEITLP